MDVATPKVMGMTRESHTRKIIQITSNSLFQGVMALCDDGTLWNICWNTNRQEWISEQIPYEIDD